MPDPAYVVGGSGSCEVRNTEGLYGVRRLGNSQAFVCPIPLRYWHDLSRERGGHSVSVKSVTALRVLGEALKCQDTRVTRQCSAGYGKKGLCREALKVVVWKMKTKISKIAISALGSCSHD